MEIYLAACIVTRVIHKIQFLIIARSFVARELLIYYTISFLDSILKQVSQKAQLLTTCYIKKKVEANISALAYFVCRLTKPI